ncbi:MAG: hypothetical protein V8S33_04870 [Intestinibacter bartlettii]
MQQQNQREQPTIRSMPMSNGKSSVVEEEYDKAIDYFDLALEAKKDDKRGNQFNQAA